MSDDFKKLADSILNEEIQEEGILDRAKVRMKNLGKNAFGAGLRTISGKENKDRVDNELMSNVQRDMEDVIKKKVIKALKSAYMDIKKLTERQVNRMQKRNPNSNIGRYHAQVWDELADTRNLEQLWEQLDELLDQYAVLIASEVENRIPPDIPPNETGN